MLNATREKYAMHRLLVTLLLLLTGLGSGCTGYVNPLTGTTLSGGVPATQSRLLGVRLPSGMECIPDHCKITGSDGLEIVRGDASPALCAQVITNGLKDQGWTLRLGTAAGKRANYVFENAGRTASITIEPQTGTTMTLVTISTSSSAPGDVPLPTASQSSGFFNFSKSDSGSADSSGSSGTSAPSGFDDSSAPISTAPLSTAPQPASSGGGIVGRDI